MHSPSTNSTKLGEVCQPVGWIHNTGNVKTQISRFDQWDERYHEPVTLLIRKCLQASTNQFRNRSTNVTAFLPGDCVRMLFEILNMSLNTSGTMFFLTPHGRRQSHSSFVTYVPYIRYAYNVSLLKMPIHFSCLLLYISQQKVQIWIGISFILCMNSENSKNIF